MDVFLLFYMEQIQLYGNETGNRELWDTGGIIKD